MTSRHRTDSVGASSFPCPRPRLAAGGAFFGGGDSSIAASILGKDFVFSGDAAALDGGDYFVDFIKTIPAKFITWNPPGIYVRMKCPKPEGAKSYGFRRIDKWTFFFGT